MPHQLTNIFVGVFDIIGFKALRGSLGTAGLVQKFERGILPLIQHSAAGRHKTENRDGNDVSVPDFNEFSANYKVFSDTVIFWTKDDSLSSFVTVIQASSQLLAAGFGTRSPYRGAIGHGDFLASGEIIVGQALEDAYLWEQAQTWAGASLTPSCEVFCLQQGYVESRASMFADASKSATDAHSKKKLLGESVRLKRYPVRLQSNPKTGPVVYSERDSLVLDWTINVFDGAAEKSIESSEHLHAQQIRQNTVNFETWARSQSRSDQGTSTVSTASAAMSG